MKQSAVENTRYIALPLLAQIIDEQGRRRVWMGEQIGVTQSMVAHVLAGRRTVSRDAAENWAGILGVPLFLIWKLADESKALSSGKAA